MEFNAVYHQASDNYCYPLNEDELIINIKTGYDVKSVSIILGDPFATGILGGGEHWDGKKEPMFCHYAIVSSDVYRRYTGDRTGMHVFHAGICVCTSDRSGTCI